MPDRAGMQREPGPQAEQPQPVALDVLRDVRQLARDPDRERLVRPLRRERDRIEPDRRELGRARQVIDDAPAEEIAVGKLRKRRRQRVDRKLAQPHRHACGLRHVGERAALDRGRGRARGVSLAPRHREREQQRRKTQREVRHARVIARGFLHRRLGGRRISPQAPRHARARCVRIRANARAGIVRQHERLRAQHAMRRLRLAEMSDDRIGPGTRSGRRRSNIADEVREACVDQHGRLPRR